MVELRLHILDGQDDAPTSPYFNGSIAQVAVIPSQLTAAQVTALHNDTTLSTYTAGVNALSPTNYWPLNDTGTVPYKGAVPNGTASTTVFDASGNANTGTPRVGRPSERRGPRPSLRTASRSTAPPAGCRPRPPTPTRTTSKWLHGTRPRPQAAPPVARYSASRAPRGTARLPTRTG